MHIVADTSNVAAETARELVALAVQAIERARDHLDHAAGLVASEEMRHSVASPATHAANRWIERANELAEIAAELS